MQQVLLSIKNNNWQQIRAGNKKLELRKAMPKHIAVPFRVICYISGAGICGEFVCDKILITNNHKALTKASGLSEEYINKYAKGSNIYAWYIKKDSVVVYPKTINLSKIGLRRPPQHWQYLINAINTKDN